MTYAADPSPWDGSYDCGFYFNAGGASATKYYINTPAELAGFSALVAGRGTDRKGNPVPADDFKGATVYLNADLDMGGVYDEASETWSGPTWVDCGA
ncbi:MAG: hypothetical protein LBG82_07710, partial [Clostridiales Family XIII bacterium]|nr:hypothetical protein [Clostridiales Family XIII bacterium]